MSRRPELQNVAGEIFVLYYRIQSLMYVFGVDALFSVGQLWGTERQFFQQPFEYRMKPAGADIFGAGIYLRRDIS